MGFMELLSPSGTGEIVSSSLACLASLVLFASYPLLLLWKLSRGKYAHRVFHPYPILTFYWSSAFWFMYMISQYREIGYPPTTCHIYSLTISVGSGSIIPGVCMFIFVSLFHRSKEEGISDGVFAAMLFMMVVGVSHLVLWFRTMGVGGMSSYDRCLAVVFGTVMYISPFPIIMDKRKAASDYLPSWLCSALFFNSFAWAVVAFYVSNFDSSFTVTNLIGASLALTQLVYVHGFSNLSMVVLNFLKGVHSVTYCAAWLLLAVVVSFYGYSYI